MADGFDSLSKTKVESDFISICEKLNDESIKKEVGSGSLRCSLKIEVIDDTAMIDVCSVDKKKIKRNRKKNNHEKEKRNVPKRKVYSRKELENLRFVGMEQQRKMWVEVYCGLDPTVQKEYDALRPHLHLHLGKENSPGGLAAKERGKHMKIYTQRGITYVNLQSTLCLPGH